MDAATYHDLQVSAYLEFAALTLLCYDHMLTLYLEFPRLWRRPLSKSSLLFLMVRYIPLLLTIVSTIFGYGHLPPFLTPSCRSYALFVKLKLLVTQVYICILMALRVIAMYLNDRHVAATVCAILSALSISCIIVLVLGANKNIYILAGKNVRRCQAAMSDTNGAFAWIAQLVFDVFIVCMTVRRTFVSWREDGRTTFYTWSLADVMFRDGAIYFCTISLANLANILSFYMAPPLLRGCVSTLASSVSLTMISRLILNLHEAAERTKDPSYAMQIDPPLVDVDADPGALRTGDDERPPGRTGLSAV